MNRMAEKLKTLLSEIETSVWDFWSIPFDFLGIEGCNADECATFSTEVYMKVGIKSEYVPLMCSYMGTSMCEIYMESIFSVLLATGGKYSDIADLRERKAVETLIMFMNNMEENGNHLKCLKKLYSGEKISAAQIQAVLACHLFSPLLSEGEVNVNNRTSQSSIHSTKKAECPFCKHPLKPGNTNFERFPVLKSSALEQTQAKGTSWDMYPTCDGTSDTDTSPIKEWKISVKDLWHGRADIVIKSENIREVVSVSVDRAEDEECDDEPPAPKTGLPHNHEFCLTEEETIFQGSLSAFVDKRLYKQAISRTLLNAFLAVKYNKNLENTLIPSFMVCQDSIFINFYNVNQDVLLVQSMPMKLFKCDVNYAAIFCVWMALNFVVFPPEMCSKFYSTAKKSGFKHCLEVKGVLQKYKDEIEDQLSSIRECNSTASRGHVVPQKKIDELVAMYKKIKDGMLID